MKFHADTDGEFNRITACGADFVSVNAVEYRGSLVVFKDRIVADWPVARMEDLTLEHARAILESSPQIVLLGTGGRPAPPHGEWVRAFAEAGVGFETMTTRAACRTFNIVAGEGRDVAAAMIVGPGADPG